MYDDGRDYALEDCGRADVLLTLGFDHLRHRRRRRRSSRVTWGGPPRFWYKVGAIFQYSSFWNSLVTFEQLWFKKLDCMAFNLTVIFDNTFFF